MKHLLKVFIASLVLFSVTAYAATSIWNATDRGPAQSTYRIPVDTSSSSGPGYVDIADISTYIIGKSTGITLPLSVANGGTGTTTNPANGYLLIGDGSGYTAGNLASGTGISIVNEPGSITISSTVNGDVVGPASGTDNAIVRFDSTTGKLIQDSLALIDDSGNITATNLSGTNTGDQTITLTGDVTGTGTGSFATTIGVGKVSNSMLAGSIAASKLVGTDIATVGTVTSGTWNATAISETKGGTGQTTYTTGDILYASASNTLSKLPVGTDGQILKLVAGIPSWASAGGTGDVVGPASATDNALVRFDSTTGKLIQNSNGILDDSGNLSGIGTIASGANTITSSSANSLVVGPNGATNPVLQVDSSTASAATGWSVTGIAAGSTGPVLAVTSSGTNEPGVINCSKGTGSCSIGTTGTGTMSIRAAGSSKYSISSSGQIHAWTTTTNGAGTTGGHYTFTGVADLSMTAGTDTAVMLMDYAQNRQHASNTTVANDRALWLKAPSFSFATAGGTITSACTLCVDAAPTAGTNASITASYAIKAETGNVYFDGKTVHAATNTAAGTTGAQTINKATGTVNFAAGASSLVVTNSLVTTSSIVFAVVRTNDTTATIKNVVPASGSFTITLGANATAETSVGFMVIN